MAVAVVDAAGNVRESAYYFYIKPDTTPPVFFGQNPANGATLVSKSALIQMSVADDEQVSLTNILVTVNGVSAFSNNTFLAGYNGPGSQVLPYPASNGYTVTIDPVADFNYLQVITVTNTASDQQGNRFTNITVFTVTPDNLFPTISNVFPANLATGVLKTNAAVFLACDNMGVLSNSITVRFITNNVTNTAILNGGLQSGFTGTLSTNAAVNGFTVTVRPTNGFAYAQVVGVTALFADAAGNVLTNSWTFTIQSDLVPPVISGVQPANGSAGNIRGVPLSFIVDDDIQVDPGSINVRINGTFAVQNGGQQAGYTVYFTNTNNGRIVTVYQTLPYGYDTAVPVQISARDTGGNESSVSLSFSIKSDDVKPWISVSDPAGGNTDVDNTKNISLTVTDDTAVDNASVVIMVNGAAALSNGQFDPLYSGTLSRMTVSGSGVQIVLDRTGSFPYRSVNTVNVSASDLNGNILSTNYSFTVKADDIAPYFTNLWPVSGSTGVATNTVFRLDAADNVEIDPQTLTLVLVTNGVTNMVYTNGSFQGLFSGNVSNIGTNGYSLSVNPLSSYELGMVMTFLARAGDSEGNSVYNGGWTFQIQTGDVVIPVISRQSPGAGQLNVEPDAPIYFETSDNVSVDRYSLSAVLIFPDGSELLALTNGQIEPLFTGAGSGINSNANNGFDVTLRHVSNLMFTNVYTVSARVADGGGNPRASTWSFTVRPPDTAVPAVESIIPLNGSEDIPVSASLFFITADNYGVWSNTVTVIVNGITALSNGVFQAGFTGAGSSFTANNRNGFNISIDPVRDFDFNAVIAMEIRLSDTSTNQASTNITFKTQNGLAASPVSSIIDPARGRGMVRIKMNRSVTAEVTVYNLRGEKVKSYAGRYYNIGDFIEWDGTLNDTGISVGSGTYYIRITGDDIDAFVKAVVLN